MATNWRPNIEMLNTIRGHLIQATTEYEGPKGGVRQDP